MKIKDHQQSMVKGMYNFPIVIFIYCQDYYSEYGDLDHASDEDFYQPELGLPPGLIPPLMQVNIKLTEAIFWGAD